MTVDTDLPCLSRTDREILRSSHTRLLCTCYASFYAASSLVVLLIVRARLNQDLPASPLELLEHVFREHATATEPCSLIHHVQKSVLCFLTDDHYALNVDHQFTPVEFCLSSVPSCPQLSNPWCDQPAFED